MIYKCEKCNKEMKLVKESNYCPICGDTIKPIDLEDKISKLYNDGKTAKEIANAVQVTDIVVDQVLAKAALNDKVKIDGLIQTEYESKIMEIINGEWDGLLKTIKKTVDSSCTYTTINYYVRKNKRVRAEAKRIENESNISEIVKMIKHGIDVQTIADTVKRSVFMIERIMLEEIAKDKSVANPYINLENKAKILEIVKNPEWDGKLKSIKEQLPEDVTYTNIKATIAKNR